MRCGLLLSFEGFGTQPRYSSRDVDVEFCCFEVFNKCRSDLSRGLSHFLGFVKKQRTNGKKDNMFVSRLPLVIIIPITKIQLFSFR